MSESIYCVYMHTSPSGKAYIGQTNNLKQRNRLHQQTNKCPLFFKAIKKYGWDNFTHEILKDNLTVDSANFFEEKLIKEYNTLSPNGYNLLKGGSNKETHPLTKIKLSLILKGRIVLESSKLKQSIKMSGRKLTEEHKKAISNGGKGKVISEDCRRKISIANTGHPTSVNVRTAVAKANAERVIKSETREKMSLAKKGKKQSPEHVALRIAKTIETRRLNKLAKLERRIKLS